VVLRAARGADGGGEARGQRRSLLVKLSSWAPQGAMADVGWTAGPKGFVAVSGWRGGPTYMYGGLKRPGLGGSRGCWRAGGLQGQPEP
jgi:hypothetical protein